MAEVPGQRLCAQINTAEPGQSLERPVRQPAGRKSRGIVRHVFTHFPPGTDRYSTPARQAGQAPEGYRFHRSDELPIEALPSCSMRKVLAHALTGIFRTPGLARAGRKREPASLETVRKKRRPWISNGFPWPCDNSALSVLLAHDTDKMPSQIEFMPFISTFLAPLRAPVPCSG